MSRADTTKWHSTLTATSFVRRFCELLAFAFGRLRHSEIHSLRPIAWLDSNGIKPLNDDVSRNAELIRESLNGFSGLDISPIITHRFDIRDYEKGFAAMISGESGKVILDWAHIND